MGNRHNLKKYVAVAVLLIVSLWLCESPVFGKYSGGTGEPNDPYIIATSEDLNDIGNEPNDWDKHFVLVNDINLSGIVYSRAVIAPDTDNTSWYFEGTPFTGTFNGGNHTIHNLTIDTSGTNNNYYIGLFGQLLSSTVVSNLRLHNVNITGGTDSTYVGGLCGANGDCDLGIIAGGTISNCYFNGSVTCGNSSFSVGGLVGLNCWGTIQNCDINGSVSGNDYSGGMVGWNFYGTISNCYTDGYVAGVDSSYAVGGLVGCSESGSISNCLSNGYVTGGDNSYAVGGLVGEQEDGDINNCYATGSVNAYDALGNLVGRNCNGSINNCYSAGTITGKSYTIGGLIGYNYFGTISSCHAADSVIGGDNSARLGGLAGWNEGTINNCYATGTVTGGIGSGHLGGLVGRNGRTITNCYAVGTVSSGTGSSNLAGFCGYQNGYYAEINNCFWDTESTGMSIGCNFGLTYPGPGTVTNLFGKTTAEMQLQSTFTDYGWDFNTPVWKFCSLPDYPKLAWEVCPGPAAPVLAGEPDITMGTSNTIFWGPAAEANEYLAECANDVNFAGILSDSGWIMDMNCTFVGLELGQEYWYRTKARDASGIESEWSNVESSVQVTLGEAVGTVLDTNSLKSENMMDALLNKIDVAQVMIEDGRYRAALNKLENDILAKTDGCAEGGEPDKSDWVISCEGQDEVYALIIETIEYVTGLME